MEGARMFQLSIIMTILSLFLNINAITVDKNDTISSSQPLTRNQTIVSAGQLFELGFFSPVNTNKWFIGIWYKELQMNTKTVVWVANRDNPLATSSGTLKIYKNRKLILTNERGKTIWQSNQTTPSPNTVAQLLDTGNFVVRRKEDSDPKNYLWQSFDYPTDTWLPGMKLGMDKNPGLNRFLTSWKNDDDPSSGDFFFKLNITGFPEFILWKKNQIKVYRSGPWNGLKLSRVQGLGTTEGLVNLSFVMDKNENTYSFQMTDSSKYTRLSLNSYGVLQSFLWIPTSQRWHVLWYAPYDHCDMYKVCGAFAICDTRRATSLCGCMKGFEPKIIQEWNLKDGSRGCARTDELNCSNDVFITVNNVKLPESSTAVLNESMISLEDCKNECQKDCACTAYAIIKDVKSGSGCVTWKGDLTDLRKYQTPMSGQPLFVRVPKVLDEKPKSPPSHWDEVKTVMVVSMALQTVLVLLSPFRKVVSSVFLSIPLWLAYQLANLAATFGLGLIAKSLSTNDNSSTAAARYGLSLISKAQTNNNSGTPADTEAISVHALWAPFLLIHLGGPDTITASALEDNELWLRHSLGIFVQGGLVAYIFAKTFFIKKQPETFFIRKLSNNKLLLPTMLIYIAGLIKYVERARALYLASTERFRVSLLTDPGTPGPNNYVTKVKNEPSSSSSKKLAEFPTEIEMTPEPERVITTTTPPEVKKMTDWEIVVAAHQYFDTFKGLIADWILSLRERTESRGFFFQRTPRDAFKVVEVELNFIYDILYTKIVVVHGTVGYILRFVTICLTCASLVLFYQCHGCYKKMANKKITLALHYCAMALDAAGLIMALTSDWTAVMLTKKDTVLFKFLRKILCIRRNRWSDKKQPDKKQGHVKKVLYMIMEFVFKAIGYDKFMEFIRRRWSGLISQYNLIHYCLNPRPKCLDKVINRFGLTKKADSFRYVNSKKIDNEIRDLIFYELKTKSEVAVDLNISNKIYSARGDWTLRATGHYDLLPWINDVDYDESLLMWHIATDLCYSETEVKNNPANVLTYRRLAKMLSDHMLYLVMIESTMMSPVAGIVEKRFKDTCAEAKKFFEDKGIYKQEDQKNNNKEGRRGIKKENKEMNKEETNDEEPDKTHVKACLNLLAVETEVKPADLEGDISKSVLFDACRLAKELKKLEEGEKWEIMSKVWVELLCYAASRCRPTTYAAQLSKGGQFITLVWLLMAHFGIGNHFQISEGHARAVPIVGE